MIEKIHRFSLRKSWPPSNWVKYVSTGPEGGIFCKVSIKTLVMKVERRRKVKAKNKMTKEVKYKVR
jgi:hypothetical protein